MNFIVMLVWFAFEKNKLVCSLYYECERLWSYRMDSLFQWRWRKMKRNKLSQIVSILAIIKRKFANLI